MVQDDTGSDIFKSFNSMKKDFRGNRLIPKAQLWGNNTTWLGAQMMQCLKAPNKKPTINIYRDHGEQCNRQIICKSLSPTQSL